MDPDQQMRNLRDFLLVYNRMTEICFQRCSSNFNYRNLTMDEERCVDNCAGKLIRSNHRLMGTYVQLMPRMVQRRLEEMESKVKAAEAAALPPAAEAPQASESSITLAPLPQGTLSVTDTVPEVQVPLSMPSELEIPPGLNTRVPKSAAASEVSLSAAAALTPINEATYPSVLNDPGSGLSLAAGLPQQQVAGAQIESSSSSAVFVPSKSSSAPADVATAALTAHVPSAASKE
ncbi:mitochondrial import inner membrane translocase subunit Tim10 B isoform X1 [Nelusetta ayraudi]|uniref:mitochondrial import inner membrane translocase subunit Tim10 B isoform X1 n=1 Tax=Nelusetta ayraudi TaxID=303726 RepID=UPI003F72F680